jgi:hypothetical protein
VSLKVATRRVYIYSTGSSSSTPIQNGCFWLNSTGPTNLTVPRLLECSDCTDEGLRLAIRHRAPSGYLSCNSDWSIIGRTGSCLWAAESESLNLPNLLRILNAKRLSEKVSEAMGQPHEKKKMTSINEKRRAFRHGITWPFFVLLLGQLKLVNLTHVVILAGLWCSMWIHVNDLHWQRKKRASVSSIGWILMHKRNWHRLWRLPGRHNPTGWVGRCLAKRTDYCQTVPQDDSMPVFGSLLGYRWWVEA